MKAIINALLVILLIQSAMVAKLYWPDAGLLEVLSAEELIPFDPNLVDEIHVGDTEDNEAVLVRAGDHWVLPDVSGLQISPQLITSLLQNVIHATTGWPVATSVAARQRFALTDYNFRRRLTLIGNGELLGTIYLGESPSFNKVYARNSVQDAIFTISYNRVDASAIDEDWLDRRILQIDAPLAVAGADFSLHQGEDGWLTDSGSKPDKREVDALVLALASLQIEGVARDKLQTTLSIAVPDMQLRVEHAAGDTLLELYTLGQSHYVRSSDYPLFFKVSSYDYDRFATLDTRRLNGFD